MKEDLSLRALLTHPDAGGLQHVAGPGNAVWASVGVASAVAGLPNDDGRGFAILTETLPAAPWLQDALIRRLHDRGFAGVALPGAAELSPGTRRLAERFGVTVVATADPIVTARACWQLALARDSLILDYVRRVARSFDYPAANIADLLEHLAKNLGHGVALIDASHTLHSAGGDLPDALREAIDMSPWVSQARMGKASASSIRVDSAGRTGLRLVVFGTGLNDTQVRALSTAAEVMMPAVAARIMIDDVTALEEVSVSAELLREFLDLRGARDTDVERRMLDRGWRTDGHHLGFQILGRTRVDAMGLLRAASQELRGQPADSHLTVSGSSVLGWLTLPEPVTARTVENAAALVRHVHAALRRSLNVATGLGSLQSGAVGLATTLNEAGDAAKLAVNRSATNYLLRVDSLGFEQLLLAWTRNDTFLPAAESLLEPLRAESSELLHTLTTFLDHESGIQATASAMGLHRNTVSARIQRAQELLGIDFAAPEARLALHLACRALPARGARDGKIS